jgi:hypothetical protein
MSKIEAFWENATADDVAKIANTRKPISARVRDEETEAWREDLISGWKLSRFLPGAGWIDADGVLWKQCQVYREPSWWTNKPDPGPWWRLLGKFPDEELKPGDEYFDNPTGKWHLSGHAKIQKQQLAETWYRRRIEPEPKHYVLRAGDSCETPCGNRIRVIPQGGTQRFFNLKVGDIVKTIHGQTITITEKGFEVTQ